MKQNFITAGILLVTTLFSMTPGSYRNKPQDPPREEKLERHIVIKKTYNNGSKTIIDTVIASNDIFVWNGDTIDKNGAFNWIAENGLNADSILKNIKIDFDIEMDDENKVLVLKSGKGGKHTIHKFIRNSDSNKVIEIEVDTDNFLPGRDIAFWNDKQSNAFFTPHQSTPPSVPKIVFSKEKDMSNIIDLSDPGIISYKKKTRKDGTEKITIIRQQVDETEIENVEEIIMAPTPGNQHVLINKNPDTKKITIIKKNGEEKKVDVEVEVEEEILENN